METAVSFAVNILVNFQWNVLSVENQDVKIVL